MLNVCHELSLELPEDEIVYEPRLMEASFGIWEGLTETEIRAQFPASLKARSDNRWNVPAPSGESYADVQARVADWYAQASLAETTIVVCHGLTSRVFRGIYADIPKEQVINLPEPQDAYFELQGGTIALVD